MPVDPLVAWWTIPVVVERCTGAGSFGPTYAAAVTVLGRVRYGSRLVRDSKGSEVMSQARVSFPATTPAIPVGSRVTVPGHTQLPPARTVLVAELHASGTGLTPDFYSIDLD